MASVDRTPDLAREIRTLRSRLAEVERQALAGRVTTAALLATAAKQRLTAKVTDGAVSVGSTAVGIVTFSTLALDNAGAWNPAQPTRLTAKRNGLYIITASVTFDANASGDRQAVLAPAWGLVSARAPGASQWQATPTAAVVMTTGQSVWLECWQNSGVTLGVSAEMTLAWLGDA